MKKQVKPVIPSRSKKKSSGAHLNISRFKAECLGLLGQTWQQGKEYIITKKGIPIAKVIPIKKSVTASRRGSLKGLAEIKGDIVHFDTSGDWEVLK